MEQLRATAARLEPQGSQRLACSWNIKGDDDLVINGEADQIDSAVTKPSSKTPSAIPRKMAWSASSASKDKGWRPRGVIPRIDQRHGHR